jgi:23S rRNA (cytosine1962-C5)-methyltransferase
MVGMAKENLALSGLGERPVRFIVDDVLKFVRREQRRTRQYDGIIMDPPSFGRGPNGEVWKIETELYNLVLECSKILSEKPLFFLINSYTDGLTASVMGNMLNLLVKQKYGGTVTFDEVGLPITASGLVVPCGACARWEA